MASDLNSLLIDLVVNCTIRAAFEYCGQKCSACGRMYVPDTLWPEVRYVEQELRQCKDFILAEAHNGEGGVNMSSMYRGYYTAVRSLSSSGENKYFTNERGE